MCAVGKLGAERAALAAATARCQLPVGLAPSIRVSKIDRWNDVRRRENGICLADPAVSLADVIDEVVHTRVVGPAAREKGQARRRADCNLAVCVVKDQARGRQLGDVGVVREILAVGLLRTQAKGRG